MPNMEILLLYKYVTEFYLFLKKVNKKHQNWRMFTSYVINFPNT